MRHRGASVRFFPHGAAPSDVLASDIDGVILSPGPGDPARLETQVALAKAIIDDGRPLLGICLGHQIVARAAGADTRRLRFGHHGANHPVQDLDLGLVQVTAQNHEVQVVSQINLNDRSVEGLRHRDKAIETVQYHPEGAPGPLDALAVFDRFVAAASGRG
jgi:carbamoyl-phosphate synthase small subunit